MIVERLIARFGRPASLLVLIFVVGTFGYRAIGGHSVSYVDSFYMTFITIATIGFSEIVDLSTHPGGRLFTMFIGFAGIAVVTYIMSSLTAFLLEGEWNAALRRLKMIRTIQGFDQHFIVCGIGRVGLNVVNELAAAGRRFVAIEASQPAIDAFRERFPEVPVVHGDASEDDILVEAGVARAAGVFAVTGDDSKNLVVTLSAKALQPKVRVVARCHEVNYIEKIRKVGADAIVSPDYTGALRVVSSMLRPNVTRFLDEMTAVDRPVRVEEILVSTIGDGRTVGELELRSRDRVLLAIHGSTGWTLNPDDSHRLSTGDVIVAMVTAAGHAELIGRVSTI